MRVPKRKSEERVKRASGPFLVTEAALALLEKEVAELEAKLPAMVAEVEHTKSHGDFSENAAYQHAKYVLRSTQGRIRRNKNKIKQAVIIQKSSSDTIELGSTVEVETGGKKFTFEILGAHEADPAKGRISHKSPLGKLLLKKKAGDEVVLKLKEREVPYKIISVN